MVAGVAVKDVTVGTVSPVTIRLKVVVWVRDPAVPVTVMLEVPIGVDDVVLTVIVVEQLGLQEVGEKEAAAAVGRPEAVKGSEERRVGKEWRARWSPQD